MMPTIEAEGRLGDTQRVQQLEEQVQEQEEIMQAMRDESEQLQAEA